MKKLLAIALAGTLLAGAGGAAGVGSQDVATEKAGDTRDCLDSSAIVSRNAEDAQTLRFELLGGRVYRNRLGGRCPGLQQASRGFGTLAFEQHGSRLCRGDILRVVDPARGRTMTLRTAPACPLGSFERQPDAPARRR